MKNCNNIIRKRFLGKRVAMLFHFFILSFFHSLYAQNDSVRASFFRDYYHQGHLAHWLDALSDRTVYQGLHLGQWDESGQLMFSVDGNSYRWNRFYIDGFRVDNRFTAGSTSYVPNMENYDLRLNSINSELRFELDTLAPDYASVSWNRGGIGGISRGTASIVHIFHGTGTEGAYDKQTIHRRQYQRGQGIPSKTRMDTIIVSTSMPAWESRCIPTTTRMVSYPHSRAMLPTITRCIWTVSCPLARDWTVQVTTLTSRARTTTGRSSTSIPTR